MEQLHFVEACTDEHFQAMSLIHALGWRDTYVNAVPADYMASEITDERWVEVFRTNYETQNGVHGLLLYRGNAPVSCLNYCKARTMNYNPGGICTFDNAAYADWGEIASFYTHPGQRGRGYGGLLMEEALRRLKADGFQNALCSSSGKMKRPDGFTPPTASPGTAPTPTSPSPTTPSAWICGM